MKKIIFSFVIMMILLVNINVYAEEINKINIENVAIPIVGEKFSDYLIRAKKTNWIYNDKLQIEDFKKSKTEIDATRGILSCTKIDNPSIIYDRAMKGQGYQNTTATLTDSDTFEQGSNYSCALGINPTSGNTISETLVGNKTTNEILVNKNSNVLINKIQSKLFKFTMELFDVYNITFDFKPGYNVSFVTNTDTTLYDVNVEPNEKVDKPTNLIKDNYEIEGWYTDENFVTKWNFDTDKVINNMTLYAKWVEKKEIQEENPNCGDNILLSIILGSISLITLTSCTLFIKKFN